RLDALQVGSVCLANEDLAERAEQEQVVAGDDDGAVGRRRHATVGASTHQGASSSQGEHAQASRGNLLPDRGLVHLVSSFGVPNYSRTNCYRGESIEERARFPRS